MESSKATRRDFLRYAGLGALASAATFVYGNETSQEVEIVERDLALPNWDADGFRIGILADPHIDYPLAKERAMNATRQLIAKRPDVIVWIGDYLTSAAPQNLADTREVLQLMNDAPCPSFGILGNHDYQKQYTNLVVDAVSSSKMRLLRNDVVELDGVRIWGADDGLMKRHRPDLIHGDRNTLVLLHEPDFVEDIQAGPSLQISGHSHGGQICMPGGIVLHAPRGAKKYTAGFYPDNRIPVYVSRGVGTTGPNWRMFCPPEATILTLRGS